MNSKYPKQYFEFFEKFNAREFYECHDLLEDIWMEDKTNKFLQGMLQMAVGIYHFECGNMKGARWMFTNAQKYLSKYSPSYWDVKVDEVISYLDRCLAALPAVDSVPYHDVSHIPFPYITLHVAEE